MNADEIGEKVGYRKPPANSRFRPGQSGNPKGRPKGSLNIATVLNEDIAREGGNQRKREAKNNH